jgi:multiple sugar transport system ATP-binding protein
VAEIRINRLSKRFADGTLAVSNADFTIHDGEFFILVGPSGCGKSTLLNMLVGLEDVSEGEIRLDGRIINAVDPKDRNMAMVFQSYALYPHMSVRENLAFPLKLAKLPRAEIARRVNEAAGILELDGLLERKPRALSGGQRQRVAMGRAIVRHPAVFLLDEPLSNLDARLRTQMRSEIARIQKRLGTTTVYVTHDQTEALTLGDRVAIMREGAIQQIGTPRDLYRQPRNLFVAGFIGSPAMNFLPATLDGDRLRLPMVELKPPADARLARSGKPMSLIAGIRPEHFTFARAGDMPQTSSANFRAHIEAVEWSGAELYAHFNVGRLSADMVRSLDHELGLDLPKGAGSRTIARLDPDTPVAAGDTLGLSLDAGRLHLFDAETGANLALTDAK